MSDPLPTLPISLSGLETVFLLDSVRNGASIKDIEDELGCLHELVLNLGSLYRELVKPEGIQPGPLSVHISKEQAWLLRAKVRTGDLGIDGQTNVGVGLSLKLYELMARFESRVKESFDEAAEDEPPLSADGREALKALRMTQEMNDARDKPGNHAD